jgi:hypothetical protein
MSGYSSPPQQTLIPRPLHLILSSGYRHQIDVDGSNRLVLWNSTYISIALANTD